MKVIDDIMFLLFVGLRFEHWLDIVVDRWRIMVGILVFSRLFVELMLD